MLIKRIVAIMFAVAWLNICCLTGAARAGEKNWKAEHPRRAEVNHRLNHQNAPINQGLKSGKLSTQQAQALRQQDQQIRQEERTDAAQNGGHITNAEQEQLNQQENAVSREIYQEKHPTAQ